MTQLLRLNRLCARVLSRAVNILQSLLNVIITVFNGNVDVNRILKLPT
jgi:hypothetical protein